MFGLPLGNPCIKHTTSNAADTVIYTDAIKLSELHCMNVSITIKKVLQIAGHHAIHPETHVILSLIVAFNACIDRATLLPYHLLHHAYFERFALGLHSVSNRCT